MNGLRLDPGRKRLLFQCHRKRESRGEGRGGRGGRDLADMKLRVAACSLSSTVLASSRFEAAAYYVTWHRCFKGSGRCPVPPPSPSANTHGSVVHAPCKVGGSVTVESRLLPSPLLVDGTGICPTRLRANSRCWSFFELLAVPDMEMMGQSEANDFSKTQIRFLLGPN